jgi:hypothetical protein
MKHNKLNAFLRRARRGRPDDQDERSFGFATRVAAQWAASSMPASAFTDPLLCWERLTRWGLAGACAVCVAVTLFQRPAVATGEATNTLEMMAGFDDAEDDAL